MYYVLIYVHSGDAAPGCSAHEDGCDGSTGTEKIQNKQTKKSKEKCE